MEEVFNYLYSFKYKDKEYIYIVSKNYPFYFLEHIPNTKKFDYPSLEVFKDLYNKFYNNDNILTFDNLSKLKLLKEKLYNLNINVKPLVRTTSGLLSLAVALSMCGCVKNVNDSDDVILSDKEAVETVNNDVEVVDKQTEIYNYFKSYDMDVIDKEYDGDDYIFVREFVNSNNKRQVTLNSFEEFRNHINIDFIPTYDDVINAFSNNENIDSDKKDIIIECINNMRNVPELKDLDLSVLYANAKRMKFQYLTEEEMISNVSNNSAYAYFDTVSGIVYLPKDKPFKKFEFVHEVIGHGSLAYRDEDNDKLTVFDCTNYLMFINDNRFNGYSVGIMISEGGANMIAHLVTNDYSVDNFYELFEEELRAIANLCNVSIGELLNHKGISFYDLMYKNNINTPVEYIFKMDGICKGKLYCEYSYLMEKLYLDATEEKIISSNDKDKIIEDTIEIIKNSYFKEKDELSFDYTGGTINYNFDEVAKSYEENANNIKSK